MRTVADLLAFGCANFPERAAIIAGARTLTFAEVDARADALVSHLAAAGLAPGDRVALLAMNEAEFLEVQVATIRAGLVLVPLNFRLAQPELAYIVGDSGPSFLIAGPGFAEVAEALEVPHKLELGPGYESALESAGPPPPHTPIDANAPNTILYTSGTTGRPKGAVISNHALHARIMSNLFEYRVSSEDRFLQCLPLFHIAANVTTTYAHAGATNILLRQFDEQRVLELIEGERVTIALLVPTMINSLVNHPGIGSADLASLHTVAYGASPIPPSVLRAALDAFGCEFLQLFGMTETSGCTILRRADHDPARFPERLASAGTEALGFDVRIVDGSEVECAVGQVGEIVCRGAAVMDEYWHAPEATSEALLGGWMHTGDLGYRDADGYVFVTDRKKDMIVSGGENVYPREVEDALFEHPGRARRGSHWGAGRPLGRARARGGGGRCRRGRADRACT